MRREAGRDHDISLSSHGMKPLGRRLLLRGLFPFLSLLLVLAFGGLNPTHAANLPRTASAPRGSGLRFVFADFDGDNHPDLATVQTVSSDPHDYWIRFRLSTLGRRYVRVTAPQGGLLIEARDVNGDNAVDLVIATAWLDKPIAVLLNEGHGNFSQVKPSIFPKAFRNANTEWNGPIAAYSCPVALLRDSSSAASFLVRRPEYLLRTKECPRFNTACLLSVRAITLRAGRAPPTVTAL